MQPNLLFVFADQWRRQSLGCMGADPVRTPCFDQFASEGMLFENGVAVSPICTPSRATILSGKHAFALNMMHNWLQFPAEEPTFAPLLSAQGYHTGYIGKWHLDAFLPGDQANIYNIFTPPGPRRLGFQFWHAHGCNHRHFRAYNMETDGRITDQPDVWQVDEETDVALEYLRNANGQIRPADQPFCLFLAWSPPHTTNPYPYDGPNKGVARQFDRLRNYAGHAPSYHYQAPEAFEAPYRRPDLPVRPNAQAFSEEYRHCAPGYFGAVESMDTQFGRLMEGLAQMGLAEDTIVVLTADHGDMLGSHGMFTKDVWYEESIGIPMMIRWPGQVPAGERNKTLFGTVDLLPTLLSLTGTPAPEGLHGRDLSPVLRGEVAQVENPQFLSHNCGSPHGLVEVEGYPEEVGRFWRGVRTDRHCYIVIDHSAASQYHNPDRFMRPLPSWTDRVLYDLEADPFQERPIYPGQGEDERMDELHDRMVEWLGDLGDPFLEGHPRQAADCQKAV